MRGTIALVLFLGLGLHGQVVPRVGNIAAAADPSWRTGLGGMLRLPSARMGARDIDQMYGYLVAGAPYCSSLAAAEYQTNRAMARSIAGYTAEITQRQNADDQTRAAIVRLNWAMSRFPCMFPGAKGFAEQPPPPAPKPEPPPFSLTAPAVDGIAAADRETARDLSNRYETDAANAAAVWKNAETLRLSLAQRNMSLNSNTTTALSRFQLFFGLAAGDLTDKKWDDALGDLQAAEAETAKVSKTVGR